MRGFAITDKYKISPDKVFAIPLEVGCEFEQIVPNEEFTGLKKLKDQR